jgi:hypothetical protein
MVNSRRLGVRPKGRPRSLEDRIGRQTRPLVREGAPQEQDRNCHTSNKDLVVSPKWVLYSKTDWPADRRS